MLLLLTDSNNDNTQSRPTLRASLLRTADRVDVFVIAEVDVFTITPDDDAVGVGNVEYIVGTASFQSRIWEMLSAYKTVRCRWPFCTSSGHKLYPLSMPLFIRFWWKTVHRYFKFWWWCASASVNYTVKYHNCTCKQNEEYNFVSLSASGGEGFAQICKKNY